jgi:hypothetical protein
VKNLSNFTLSNLKNDILFNLPEVIVNGKNILIEFNSKIIYEFD